MVLTPRQLITFSPFIHPVDDGISQKFGENKVSFYKELGMKGHNGIDYSCKAGTKIYAPCDLKITGIRKEDVEKGYGNSIFARTNTYLEINKKLYSLEMVFGHLKEFKTTLRDWVKQGELIAISGNTGKYTTGPHLHWGVRVVEKQQNGGWLAINRDNGYKGYIDQLPLVDNSLKLKEYEGKLVYSTGEQDGKKHYLVRNRVLEHISNEVEFFIAGFDFKDAVGINPNLIIVSDKITYKIDNNDIRVKQAKNLLDFAINHRSLAIKYRKNI